MAKYRIGRERGKYGLGYRSRLDPYGISRRNPYQIKRSLYSRKRNPYSKRKQSNIDIYKNLRRKPNLYRRPRYRLAPQPKYKALSPKKSNLVFKKPRTDHYRIRRPEPILGEAEVKKINEDPVERLIEVLKSDEDSETRDRLIDELLRAMDKESSEVEAAMLEDYEKKKSSEIEEIESEDRNEKIETEPVETPESEPLIGEDEVSEKDANADEVNGLEFVVDMMEDYLKDDELHSDSAEIENELDPEPIEETEPLTDDLINDIEIEDLFLPYIEEELEDMEMVEEIDLE